MSKILKLFLICFLSLSVFSFRSRLRQVTNPPEPEVIPPPQNGNNQTINQTALPRENGAERNATEPAIREERQNRTQPSNATEAFAQPQIPEAPQNITGEPQIPEAPKNITEEPMIPEAPQNITEEPMIPEAPQNITGEGEMPVLEPFIGNVTGANVTGEVQNITDIAIPASAEAEIPQALPSEQPLVAGGINLPSTTVVSVSQPVISVVGEASGTIQSDLIKIGVLLQSQNAEAGEALNQNQQQVIELMERLKELGVQEANILNLGVLFSLPTETGPASPEQGAGEANQTLNNQTDINEASNNATNGAKDNGKLGAIAQLEIQVKDAALAAKVIDLLNSLNYQIKYVDFNYTEDTLAYAVNNLIELAMRDAQTKAQNSLVDSKLQIGQIINLNVKVDKDHKSYVNYMKDEQQGIGMSNPQGIKIIKVIVTVTYTLDERTTPEEKPQETPQLRKHRQNFKRT